MNLTNSKTRITLGEIFFPFFDNAKESINIDEGFNTFLVNMKNTGIKNGG